MTTNQPRSSGPDEPGATGRPGKRRDGAIRRLAEWVSLAVSGLLLLSLAGYVLLQALRRDAPYVMAEARPLIEQARRRGKTFVLPLRISNPGMRTLQDLEVEVRYRSAEGQWESQDLQIAYLGKRSHRTIYLYFDRHPRDLELEARPVHYRVE